MPAVHGWAMISVVIYSRAGCHLCDDMKDIVRRVSESVPLSVQEVDVDSDPVLAERFGSEVPVLMIEGKKAAKYRITEDALRRVLSGRS
jgi:hypothetical protein